MMDQALEPPRFSSIEAYGRCFTDAGFWRPYVELVCARHGLGACREVRAGLPGTNAVFIVDERYAVKLYTSFFGGARSYPSEHAVYRLIAATPGLPAPALVAAGDLFPQAADWRWPYLVTTVVPGSSLGEERARLSHAELQRLAASLGRLVRQLHELPLMAAGDLPATWDTFLGFLERQRRACVDNHRRWGSLPAALLAQLEGYLLPPQALAETSLPPRLLHADLNEDHVLGRAGAAGWQLTGLIDFGDARVGDPLYELQALHLGLFYGDKRLLRSFLERYGLQPAQQRDFARRALSYTLLHECDVLGFVLKSTPALAQSSSLDQLADMLWRL